MSWLHKMWAHVFIPWDWELSLSSGISLFPWHVHIRLLLMPVKFKLWAAKRVHNHGVCGSWESTHASLNKIHPPSKDRKIFKILSFVNTMVIPEHHSMTLSSQVSFFWTALSTWLPSKATTSLWCVDLLEKRFFRPCDNHGFFSLFLLNALTQLQCTEILPGDWLLWLAPLCGWPYRSQENDSSWNLTQLVPATLRGWGGENWGHLTQSLHVHLSLQAVGGGSAEFFKDHEDAFWICIPHSHSIFAR